MATHLLTTLLTLAALAQDPAPPSYLDTFQRAWQALEADELTEARALYATCLELSPENAICAYHLACVESRSGELGRAQAWLDRAVDWGWSDAGVALWDSDLDPIKETEPFGSTVARMGRAVSSEAVGQPVQVLWDPLLVRSWPKDPAPWDDDLKIQWSWPLSRNPWPAVSPSGDLLVVPCNDGTLRCLSPTSMEESRRIRLAQVPLSEAVFDQAGSRLLVRAEGPRSLLLDWPTARVLAVHEGESFPASLAPDGLHVLTATKAGQLQVWSDSEEVPVMGIERGKIDSRSMAWSPDGQLLAVGGHKDDSGLGWLHVVDVTQGGMSVIDLQFDEAVRCASFSPTGCTLAVGTTRGLVRLIDPRGGRELRRISHAGSWGVEVRPSHVGDA